MIARNRRAKWLAGFVCFIQLLLIRFVALNAELSCPKSVFVIITADHTWQFQVFFDRKVSLSISNA